MTRSLWGRLHRWAGLAMAGFLVVVGLTGALLAFLPELNRLTAPQLFPPARACTAPDATTSGAIASGVTTPARAPLDLASFAERAQALVPTLRVNGVYAGQPGTVLVYLAPRPDPAGGAVAPGFDSIFFDPCSGAELGRRQWGDLSQGWVNAMP